MTEKTTAEVRIGHIYEFSSLLHDGLKAKGAKLKAIGPINPAEWKKGDLEVIEIEYEGQHYFLTVSELKGDDLKTHQNFLEEWAACKQSAA